MMRVSKEHMGWSAKRKTVRSRAGRKLTTVYGSHSSDSDFSDRYMPYMVKSQKLGFQET